PPWEPAMEPTSQLPWVVPPPPGTVKAGSADTPTIAPPPDSVWDSAPARRSSAPRSLFEPAPPPPPATPQRRAAGSGQLGQGQTHPSQPGTGQPGTGRQGASQPGQPTSWQDLPGHGNTRPETDSDRGPIFSWSPTGSTDQFAAVDQAGINRRRDNDRRRG